MATLFQVRTSYVDADSGELREFERVVESFMLKDVVNWATTVNAGQYRPFARDREVSVAVGQWTPMHVGDAGATTEQVTWLWSTNFPPVVNEGAMATF